MSPMDTTNLRHLVTCRPTINFQLPSALGDQVHNLETFGLKAEPVLGQLPVPTPAPVPTSTSGSSSIGTRFWKSDLTLKCQTQSQLSLWSDPGTGKEDVDVGGGGGGRYDLSPVTARLSFDGAGVGMGMSTGVGMGDSMGNGHTSIARLEQSRNAHDSSHRYLVDNNTNPNRLDCDGGDQLHPRAQAKKIHPRPMYNQTHRAPLINIIQPPPHTYTPNGLYPSPITTTSSHSSLFRHSDPRLPGLNQLFDDYPLPLPFPPSLAHNGHGHGHTLSAPPSTIFPNHLRSQDRYPQQHSSYTPSHTQSTHFHPPPFPTLNHSRSASTSQYSYNHDRDYDHDMMDLDAESGLDRQEMDLSQSPSLISVSVSVDQHQDQGDDYEMDISRRSSITGSSESEEAEEEEEEEEEGDEEVLSEYKPNYKSKSKGKGIGKGKVPVMTKMTNPPRKVKDVPNAAIINMTRLKDNRNGVGHGSVRVSSSTEGSNMGHQTKIPKGRGKFNGGYTFIYEDGVAYTDDAELKQTREVCLLYLSHFPPFLHQYCKGLHVQSYYFTPLSPSEPGHVLPRGLWGS